MAGVRGVPHMPRQSHYHFRFPDPTDVRCFTKHFEWSNNASFICYEEYTGINSIDNEFVTTTITLNIGIDNSRNIHIRDDAPDGNNRVPHHFVDYQHPLTLFEKLAHYFQQLFH